MCIRDRYRPLLSVPPGDGVTDPKENSPGGWRGSRALACAQMLRAVIPAAGPPEPMPKLSLIHI
eukprot:1793769-Alexandrium_andersonii.AAC.1